ncbi:MAG: hypothetical protein E4H00_08390 [Myxococcales bacterium]|nr:MAG: hypothetical protein E4H00_08390 [Myxococcales bacterium]
MIQLILFYLAFSKTSVAHPLLFAVMCTALVAFANYAGADASRKMAASTRALRKAKAKPTLDQIILGGLAAITCMFLFHRQKTT